MSCLMVLALVGGSPVAKPQRTEFESLDQVTTVVESDAQTGTLLVTQGDCLAVRVYTQSPYTHVAAVVVRNGKPVVYDSVKGTGARCLPLKTYLQSVGDDEIHVFQPRRAFSESRAGKFEAALDSQLGRPYAVRHHLSGERGEGLHCSEYVTDALMAGRVISAKQPARVSPASLVEGITKHGIYSMGTTLSVKPPQPRDTQSESGWCAGLWDDTKTCTSDCWKKVRGWCLCE